MGMCENMSKYSIILWHTTSKETRVYNVEDKGTSALYYKFDISVGDFPEGEAEFVLIENPRWDKVLINLNNPFKSKIVEESAILVTYKDTLTNGLEILVVGENAEMHRIKPLESGLMRVGSYKEEMISYDKQTKYKEYGKQ